MSRIDNFLEIQDEDDNYNTALSEIKEGSKQTCWIWYIFPQIIGLGNSLISKQYSITDIEEAKEYLENETLRSRLIEISQALLDLENTDARTVMGYDDVKLKSSMTLFKIVEETYNIDCGKVFEKVLDKYFNGEVDNRTITILEKQKFEKQRNMINKKNNENINKEKNKNEEKKK